MSRTFLLLLLIAVFLGVMDAITCYKGFRMIRGQAFGTETEECENETAYCYNMTAEAAMVFAIMKAGCSTYRCMLQLSHIFRCEQHKLREQTAENIRGNSSQTRQAITEHPMSVYDSLLANGDEAHRLSKLVLWTVDSSVEFRFNGSASVVGLSHCLFFFLSSGTTMKYLAAYVLSTMGGNKSPTAKDIENVLGSVGLDVDMEDANKVVSALSGKSIGEVITAGLMKISSVPSGDAAAPAVTAAALATPSGALEAESRKGALFGFIVGISKLLFLWSQRIDNVFAEEKKEEPKEESDEDMGFGLFD
uniref:Large ribosomal subunit protein P2 n=1 Tax=Setaria digitata TaxID=48799 RepID=A0A915Q022_9BILA